MFFSPLGVLNSIKSIRVLFRNGTKGGKRPPCFQSISEQI
jgi:hypothetical protein